MKRQPKLYQHLVWLLALSLPACVTVDVDTLRHMTPSGSAFDAALYREYLALTQQRVAAGDAHAASLFASKARAAAHGQRVEPEAIEDRRLPAAAREALVVARARLSVALVEIPRPRAPRAAARAQAMFDCWLEAQAEPPRRRDAADCRAAFRAAMEVLNEMSADR